MRYGAEYYPDHWPEERWAAEADLMHRANINVTRLAEFAWCRLEPEPGTYDFGWLDRAISVMNDAGIDVILGTPTAGPPIWLTNPAPGRPDCRQVYEDGGAWEPGGRSMCCVNHQYFVECSARIAGELGARYSRHPGVIGFQIDNELGMYGTRCYCPVCVERFRTWLRDKYGTIEILNERLGMIFGGNEFRTFGDVPIPRRRQDLHNPGLLLDSQRFFSDSHVRFTRAQQDALRASGVSQPVTTNVCHMFAGGDMIDGLALFDSLDLVGWDCYPLQFGPDGPAATVALLHAIARGYKAGRRYWMLEQQAGAPSGVPATDERRIRLWTWQSIAHGADLILYWHWRSTPFGGETYWRGILDHDGAINARYTVVAETGAEVARLAPRLDRLERANDIAIFLDYETSVSLDFSAPGGGLRYRPQAEVLVSALQSLAYGFDVVFDAADLSRYRMVMVPVLRLIDSDLAAKLEHYVRQGGTLVATPLLATLDRDHRAPLERPPYLLSRLFGVERVEWSALGSPIAPPKELTGKDAEQWDLGWNTSSFTVVRAPDSGLGGPYVGRAWLDHLQTIEATTLASLDSASPYGALPVVTENHAGSGRALYVGMGMDMRFFSDLFDGLLGPSPSPIRASDRSARVEIVPCRAGDEALYFVFNHEATPHAVRLARALQDLLYEHDVSGELVLPPYGVGILSERLATHAKA